MPKELPDDAGKLSGCDRSLIFSCAMRALFVVAFLAVSAGTPHAAMPKTPTEPAQIPAYVGANGKFSKPDKTGRFPTVVIMHGCGGPPGHSEWVKRLNEWGYATYYIDSFTPRNLKRVCAEQQFKGYERVGDAYAALAHLRTRPDVKADKVGLIGFSHGGSATAYTVRAHNAAKANMPPFAAAVAYYGGCRNETFQIATDLLILIGEADDWANVKACPRMMQRQDRPTKDRLTVVVYPRTYHDFDIGPRPPRQVLGHHIEYNEAAAKDSFERTKAFFDQRLKK
jgi:dienelactone hydrolase